MTESDPVVVLVCNFNLLNIETVHSEILLIDFSGTGQSHQWSDCHIVDYTHKYPHTLRWTWDIITACASREGAVFGWDSVLWLHTKIHSATGRATLLAQRLWVWRAWHLRACFYSASRSDQDMTHRRSWLLCTAGCTQRQPSWQDISATSAAVSEADWGLGACQDTQDRGLKVRSGMIALKFIWSFHVRHQWEIYIWW